MKYKDIFPLSVISQYWDYTGPYYSSSRQTRYRLFCIINTMALDDLVTRSARASPAMVLTWFSRNIQILRTRRVNWITRIAFGLERFDRFICFITREKILLNTKYKASLKTRCWPTVHKLFETADNDSLQLYLRFQVLQLITTDWYMV